MDISSGSGQLTVISIVSTLILLDETSTVKSLAYTEFLATVKIPLTEVVTVLVDPL